MLPGCPPARGPPLWRLGVRRASLLLVLSVASLGSCPAAAVNLHQVAEREQPRHGLSKADDEDEVILGNGDDLPGFGTYLMKSTDGSPERPRVELSQRAEEFRLMPGASGGDPRRGLVRLKTGHYHVPGFSYEQQDPKRPSHPSMPKPSPAVRKFLFFCSIVIAFFGSTLTVMGMVLQKHAHQKLQEEADSTSGEEDAKDKCLADRYCYLFNWRWILGLVVFAAGNAMTWVALGMGPNSVLACFNSWNIIFSMVIAPMWFGEHVPLASKLSAVVLIGGCIWVTIAGPRSYRLHTIDSINMLFARFPFTLCCIICFTILVAAKIKHWFWQTERVWTSSASVQITSMASIFACYAVLFSKCTSMLVQSSVVSNVSQVGYWQFYLWSGATVVCGICQIYFLNESLRHGLASFVIPAYESMGMALQIIVGGIFFREYRKFSLAKHMSFWPGVLLVLSGLIFLTRSVAPSKAEEDSPPEAEKALQAQRAGEKSPKA